MLKLTEGIKRRMLTPPRKSPSPPTPAFRWFRVQNVSSPQLGYEASRTKDVKRWFTQCFGFLSTSSVKTNAQGPSR